MRLKKYIVFSILLMIIIGAIVYSQIDATYTIDIFGIPVTLPVAVWIVLPMFIMFIASFFHMSYYSFINFMKLKRYKKDYVTLVDAVSQSLIREPKTHSYKTSEAKNIGSVVDKSHIIPIDFKIDTKEEKLKTVLGYIKDIENGIYVEIEGFKLSNNNPLLIKNLESRLKNEPTFSGVILKKCDEYPKELCRKALKIFISIHEISRIKDYAKLFDTETLLYLINQRAEHSSDLHYQDILYIIQEANIEFDEKGYIELAKVIKNILSPDERLLLFEKLKERDEKSEGGYLYTLLDLEMIDKAIEFLETTNEEELLNFKAYLELKQCGKNFPLEMFV